MVRATRTALLALAMPLLVVSAAFAQDKDPREAQARKDCLTGKYEAGAALLAELFTETSNPNFIYNQARCYEQNARPDEAIQRFREFLRIARDLSAEDKKEVENHIAECRAMKAEQEKERSPAAGAAVMPAPAVVPGAGTAATPAPAAAPAPEVAATPAPAPAAPVVVPAVAPPASPPSEGISPPAAAVATTTPAPAPEGGSSSLRTWAIVIGSVGVVAVGAGVVFSVLTQSTKQQVESDGRSGFFDPSKDSDGRTYASMQWVGYGVGAAGIVTAAIMYAVGGSKSQPSGGGTVAVVPAVGTGQGGVLLHGSF